MFDSRSRRERGTEDEILRLALQPFSEKDPPRGCLFPLDQFIMQERISFSIPYLPPSARMSSPGRGKGKEGMRQTGSLSPASVRKDGRKMARLERRREHGKSSRSGASRDDGGDGEEAYV